MKSHEWHEDFPLPHVVYSAYTTSCKHCLVSPQRTTQKLIGVHRLLCRLCDKYRRRCLSSDCNSYIGCTWRGYNWFSHSTAYCRVTSAGWWGFRAWYQIYLPVPQPTACARGMRMPDSFRLRWIVSRLSPIRISVLMFLQCNERISIAKIIHELYICKLLGILLLSLFLSPVLVSESVSCSSTKNWSTLNRHHGKYALAPNGGELEERFIYIFHSSWPPKRPP